MCYHYLVRSELIIRNRTSAIEDNGEGNMEILCYIQRSMRQLEKQNNLMIDYVHFLISTGERSPGWFDPRQTQIGRTITIDQRVYAKPRYRRRRDHYY